MSTRKIIDPKQNGEKVWLKGHAQATFMSDGSTVEQQIAGKMDKVTLAPIATSGNYDDLSNKPTIPNAVTESTVSGWGFTKSTGTYSKPSTGIPKNDLASAVQTSLGKADTALQSEQYKGTVTGVKINGSTKSPSSGVVDLGTVITSHQDLSGKQDKLVSGTNIKTINGASILGSGNIVIEGGSGGSSSGGSGAYAEVNHGTGDTTFILTPNTFHVWDEVASLDLSFAEETAGVANEYLFQFTSGATATMLTLPDVKWVNDVTPEIISDKLYLISILNNMASIMEFNNSIFPYTLYFYEDQETPAERNPNSQLLYTKLLEMINSGLNPSTLVIVVSSGPYFMGYTPFTISTITNKPGIIIADVGARMYYYILQEDGSITYYDYD